MNTISVTLAIGFQSKTWEEYVVEISNDVSEEGMILEEAERVFYSEVTGRPSYSDIAFINLLHYEEEEEILCRYCQKRMTIWDNGASHHLDYDDNIDYGADGNHVAVAEKEPGT